MYHDQFRDAEPADIETLPLEDVVLNAKMLGVTDVATFPFVTRPSTSALDAAHIVLARLGAFHVPKTAVQESQSQDAILSLFRKAKLGSFGRSIATLAIGVRCAATTLAAARETRYCSRAQLCVMLVACGAERTPFVKGVPAPFRHPLGDAHSRLLAAGAYALRKKEPGLEAWCQSNGLDHVSLGRIEKLQRVLAKAVLRAGCFEGATRQSLLSLDAPATAGQDAWLARAVAAGRLDRLARKADPNKVAADIVHARRHDDKLRRPSRYERECAYELLSPPTDLDVEVSKYAYISADSAMHSRSRSDLPDWIVCVDLEVSGTAADSTSNRDCERRRLVIRSATAVNGAWIAQLAVSTGFVDLGDPVDDPAPTYDAASDTILAYCRPLIAAADASLWNLPLVRYPLTKKRNPAAFRLALARLLVDGTLLPGPKNRGLKLFSFAQACSARSKQVTALLNLLKCADSVCHLRQLLHGNCTFEGQCRSILSSISHSNDPSAAGASDAFATCWVDLCDPRRNLDVRARSKKR